MKKAMKGKNVLVTGGTGSIGSEIVRQSLEGGAEKVIVFSRDEIKQHLMKTRLEDPRLVMIMGDVRDIESARKIFEMHHVDILFHASAMKHLVVSEDEPIECIKTNVIGTSNVMRLASKNGVEKIVNISTDKAASPTSVMGASKFIAERIVMNYNRMSSGTFSSVRFGNVANSRGSVIPIMVERLQKEHKVRVSHPEMTRFMMRISDAVNLVLKASQISHGGEIFVLKMKSFKLGDLGRVMAERVHPKLFPQKGKAEMYTTLMMRGEKLHEDLLNDVEFSRLYESDQYYLIPEFSLDEEQLKKRYFGFKESDVISYSSKEAPEFNLEEIEKIIDEYLDERFGGLVIKR